MKSLNKIALLTDGIHPYVIGGMQKHSFNLAKYFAQNKIHVDLFHYNQGEQNIKALDVFTEEEKLFINSTIINFPKLNHLPGHYIRESYKYSELIYEIIKSKLNSYDFIYTKGFTGWKLIEEKSRGMSCPPIGVNFHGYEMFQRAYGIYTKLSQLFFRSPVKWINQNADFVFSYGGKITNLITKNLNVNPNKIIEIPAGIESNWINPETIKVNHVRRFVFIGRHERRKGIEELNKALNSILYKCDFIFEFIGPIPHKQQLISEKIVYHGELKEPGKIKSILRQSDILVCPSHSEGMPNVILEAMASGLTIIASNVGAIKDEVDSKNGILVKPANVDELCMAIISLCNLSQEDLLELKLHSIQKVKNKFLWEQVILLTISQLNNAINTR